MFTAILMVLFPGMVEPALFQTKEPPFVSRAACEEWSAQERRRLDRALAAVERKPELALTCVALGTGI